VTGSRGAGPVGSVTTGLGSAADPGLAASRAIDATFGPASTIAAPPTAPAVLWRNTRRLEPSIAAPSSVPLAAATPAGMPTLRLRNERRLNFPIVRLLSDCRCTPAKFAAM
jgi:hypothetical protein